MENKLALLKENFNKIMDIRSNIQEIFDILHVKIVKLQTIHSDLMQLCKTQLFVFGMDSFRFQNKIIDIEYDDMMRYFLAINNRMYCEYYKLYKIVVEYIQKNTKDSRMIELSKLNKFPLYKDLEPFKEYKISVLTELHESLLTLIGSMNSYVHQKQHELLMHEGKKNIGLDIDNFIYTFNHTIIITNEKITLFVKYIEFFHILHTKYLQRFSNKIQLMYNHINNDIHLEGNMQNNNDSDILNLQTEIYPITINANTNTGTNNIPIPITTVPEQSISGLNSSQVNEIIPHLYVSTDTNDSDPVVAPIPPPSPMRRPPLLSKTKSVSDILLSSSKSSSEEDIVVYSVFSAIDNKCNSIHSDSGTKLEPIVETEPEPDAVPFKVISVDPPLPPPPPIIKRRGRKKKSESTSK